MSIVIGSSRDRTAEGIRRALHTGAGRPAAPAAARALAFLPLSDMPEEEQATLAVGLLGEDQEASVRATALRALGHIGGATACEALRRSVDLEEPPLVCEAATALAHCGGPPDLRVLLHVAQDSASGLVRRKALAGAWILSHRHRLEAELAPFPGLDAPLLRPSVSAEPLHPTEVSPDLADGALLASAGRNRLTLSGPAVAGAFRQGRCEQVVLVATGITTSSWTERRALAAAVYGYSALQQATLRFLLLTRPIDEDRVELVAIRRGGTPCLRGEGRVTPGGLQLRLLSLARPGTIAAELEAGLTADHHVVVRGRADLVRQAKREPEPCPDGTHAPASTPARDA
ncbi:HEAT repeat domain-containing protein [Streptomyces sp. NPDC005533]|uniref:HEAT repeat domain-containing protein n=1 Tax=Streptomyces sp. NPDC005533 TaxID=3364723 RepID=UPI0036AC1049